LINITAPEDIALSEINEAVSLVQEAADPDAENIFGALINDDEEAKHVKITLIATGFTPRGAEKRAVPPPVQARVAAARAGDGWLASRGGLRTAASDRALGRVASQLDVLGGSLTPAVDEETWYIPTFLRKQGSALSE